MSYHQPVLPRSAGSIPARRVPQSWPPDRDFRILSIDGGGIRGIFPAAVLADLESTIGPGNSIAEHFDLVAGTSTGGILALGLGAGKSAREIRDLYMHRGPEIFPPVWDNILGRGWKAFRNNILNATFHRYSRQALERVLQEFLGDRIFGESSVRHVIPAFDGRFSEVFLFKTRHHPDYEQDWRKRMVDIGLATSAAPTIYRPLESGGYRLIDGGVWANNPTMLAVVEAMIAYDVPRDRIKVLEHRMRRRALPRHPAHDVGRPVALAEDHRRRDAGPVAGRDQPGAPAARTRQRGQDRADAGGSADRTRRLQARDGRIAAGRLHVGRGPPRPRRRNVSEDQGGPLRARALMMPATNAQENRDVDSGHATNSSACHFVRRQCHS